MWINYWPSYCNNTLSLSLREQDGEMEIPGDKLGHQIFFYILFKWKAFSLNQMKVLNSKTTKECVLFFVWVCWKLFTIWPDWWVTACSSKEALWLKLIVEFTICWSMLQGDRRVLRQKGENLNKTTHKQFGYLLPSGSASFICLKVRKTLATCK